MSAASEEFARFYLGWEKQLDGALKDAAAKSAKRLADLPVGLGATRARLINSAINSTMDDLYGSIGDMIRTGRIDAARLGARVATQPDVDVMKALGMSDADASFWIAQEEYRAAAGIEAAARRATTSQIPLSRQVYNTRELSKGYVDRAVTSGLARGLSFQELAKEVKGFISPATPGGVSFAAKRLARTELNNAFHGSAKARIDSSPFTEGARWETSGSHPKTDICDEYADADNGIGPGVYRKGNIPDKPHPQCLCSISSVTIDKQKMMDGLLNGEFDEYLDDIMSQSGYTQEFIESSRFRNAALPKPTPIRGHDKRPYELAQHSSVLRGRLPGYKPTSGAMKGYLREYDAAVVPAFERIAAQEIKVRVSGKSLERIAEQGRFKTTHEVRTSRVHNEQESYTRARLNYEQGTVGVPVSQPITEMPVYGYLHTNPSQFAAGIRTRGYGDWDVVMKEHVRGRTSMTAGDSLNGESIPVWIDDVQRGTVGRTELINASDGMLEVQANELLKGQSLHKAIEDFPDYWEAQIHGGVAATDIELVRVTQAAWDAAPDSLKAALKKARITVEVTP